MKPFFSIIIPTLNEEAYIAGILGCLKKQKQKNFEVILVDGNSQDRTRAIALSFKHYFPLRIIHLSKGNLSLQKNMGGQKAKADTLIFFDADMRIRDNFTLVAERELKMKKGFIYIPHVFPIEKKEFPEVQAAMQFFNQLVGLSLYTNIPFSAGPPQIWNKSVFNHMGGFENIFGEDHHIIRKAQDWGIRARHVPRLKVWFSMRRVQQQGKLKLFSHFILAHTHLLFSDTLTKGFEYKMGGQLYQEKRKELTQKFSIGDIRTAGKRVQSFFQKLLKDE